MEHKYIGYFSMEIAFDDAIPTYSGGLGILAGDFLRSGEHLNVPMIGVTLLHRKGYFKQTIDPDGNQKEESIEWNIEEHLEEENVRASVTIEGRTVLIRAWKYYILDGGNIGVPIYLLDTDLPENSPFDRTLTQFLYGGDLHYRLCQEVILGIGGYRILEALKFPIRKYHMNEGHAAFVALELLTETAKKNGREIANKDDINEVRSQCLFTTHTPVASGHDQFPLELVDQVMGKTEIDNHQDLFCSNGFVNMTYIALNLSYYVNGVAHKHQEVTQMMFSKSTIDAITNGVHIRTWASPPFHSLFDKYIPQWYRDTFSLRYALNIPPEEIWNAHQTSKDLLFKTHNLDFDRNIFTIGFARRMTGYKRATLIFENLERLKAIAKNVGAFQILFAGKAHPNDTTGKQLIYQIIRHQKELEGVIKIAFLPNYDRSLAKLMVSGVDLWLNNPQAPLEASGTSGMKAAVNGVPSLSILDGWWIEGHIEGVTGWAIDGKIKEGVQVDNYTDSEALLDKLEQVIIPLYYKDRNKYIDIMTHSIALNGSFFNTQRMFIEYMLKAYSSLSCSIT